MYYPSSENKGADLGLYFGLGRLLVFPWGGSFIYNNTSTFDFFSVLVVLRSVSYL